MRSERFYLNDICESAEAIIRFVENESEDSFAKNEILQSAVIYKFSIIGEAASKVSAEVRDRHDEIDWKAIIGFRNVLVHQYFSYDVRLVWLAASERVLTLLDHIRLMLQTEFADDPPDANGDH